MTHLACADERDGEATRAQLARFAEVTQGLKLETSIVNSAGLLGDVAPMCEWVRPGIALYGASPFEDRTAADFGLKPVMTLISSVLTVREIAAGERVGYGGAWTAPRRLAHRDHRGRLRRWRPPQLRHRHPGTHQEAPRRTRRAGLDGHGGRGCHRHRRG